MTNATLYEPTPADLARIPDVLKTRDQWILWKAEDKRDKTGAVIGLNKIPHTIADPDIKASSTDPLTWGTFAEAVAALDVALESWELADPSAYRGGGVGYVFTADDPYCGVDLDHAVDPSTDTVAPWAQGIVDQLQSYTQRSCSGTGLHVLIEATLPPGRCQDGDLQMWDHARFFAMTGWHVAGTPATIEPRQGPLEQLWCAHFGAQVGDLVQCLDEQGGITNPVPWAIERIELTPDGRPYACFAESPTGWPLVRCEVVPPTRATGQPLSPSMTDDVILQRVSGAKNGAKFAQLWAGDWSGYASQSEADLALCLLLAFWTQDPDQLSRLFEDSGLYRAEKWTKRFDYRQRTIAKALAGCSAFYQPPATLHVNGSHNGAGQVLDPATLTQQLYDALLALPDDQRTPDALYQHAGTLAALPGPERATWKAKFKGLLGQRLNMGDFNALLKAALKQAAEAHRQALAAADHRPTIRFDTEMTRYTDEGQAALLKLPGAPIYQRARRLSIITQGGQAPRWLHRPPDMASIALLTPEHLRELAGLAARWEAIEDPTLNPEPHEITPPQLFVDTLMARPGWLFPTLEGVIHAPTLRPDGSVLDTPGYDPDTGLFYDPGTTCFPPIPHAPDVFEAQIALNMLKDALCDFPFAHDYDRSAALAAILSMACRFTTMGCVPLFAVTAPVRGSGKSYLVDTLSIIGTGRPAPRWPQVIDPDEERKRLLTVALAGYPAVHIDNVSRPLGSPALDLALTAPSFTDRILGQTGSVEAPLNMVWLASGNNMQYQGDTARRVVPITMDPALERPEERTGFTHDPLIPWVQTERPRLTVAALTVVKAYFAEGCPSQGLASYGSFEAWSDLIRQALVWCGEADPCAGRRDLEATADASHDTRSAVLASWYACYGHTAVTLKTALGQIAHGRTISGPGNQWDDLFSALAACDQRHDGKTLDARRIGNDLRTWQGRFYNGLRLVSPGKDRKGIAEWRVEGTLTTP